MAVLEGARFLMSEVPLYKAVRPPLRGHAHGWSPLGVATQVGEGIQHVLASRLQGSDGKHRGDVWELLSSGGAGGLVLTGKESEESTLPPPAFTPKLPLLSPRRRGR